MNKIIFCLLSFVTLNLEASYFQSSVSVTPLDCTEKKHYLVELQIEKVLDEYLRELIAAPKIGCTQGEPAKLTISSNDSKNILSIEVMIPDADPTNVCTSILLEENGQVVLSHVSNIKMNF